MIFNKEIMDSTQNFFFRHLQSHFTSNMTLNSYIRHVMYLSSNHVKSARFGNWAVKRGKCIRKSKTQLHTL